MNHAKWSKQCAVVIPCLNEETQIASLVRSVRAYLPQVVVVDDGSTDQTSVLAKESGAIVIRHERSLGKGAALMAGWRHARAMGFPWTLNMDGDGQHAPEDIPGFLSAAEQGDSDLIIGDRMIDPRGMPWVRLLVNRWMSRRLSRVAGHHLPDTQCGFRLMRLDVWAKLPLRATHFEIESEQTLAFARAGHQIKFVPVRVVYRDERSKIHPLRDTIRWFRWWRHMTREMNAASARSAEISLVPHPEPPSISCHAKP